MFYWGRARVTMVETPGAVFSFNTFSMRQWSWQSYRPQREQWEAYRAMRIRDQAATWISCVPVLTSFSRCFIHSVIFVIIICFVCLCTHSSVNLVCLFTRSSMDVVCSLIKLFILLVCSLIHLFILSDVHWFIY